jgi:hypothetical protein
MDRRDSHGERMWETKLGRGRPRFSQCVWRRLASARFPRFHRDVWPVTADRPSGSIASGFLGFVGFLGSGEGPSSPHRDGREDTVASSFSDVQGPKT